MSQALHPMLNIAIKAAREAGKVINRGANDLDKLQVEAKGQNDFVTEVDREAERVIVETILQAYPGHGILGEESGRTQGAKDSEFLWIIDPLDGTTNFIHGLPIYAVSIALTHRGQVQQAVVYDPARNDLFYASKGKGAFLNDRRLRVSRRTRLADSLIGTGFPFRKGDNFKRYMSMFETIAEQCAGLRRPGAASIDLCYVAAGFYDGFFETGLSAWDVAAGSLIITEAGGLVGNFTGEGDYLYQQELVAATPRVFGQLIQLLKPFSKVTAEAGASAASEEADADDTVAVDATALFAASVNSSAPGRPGAMQGAPSQDQDSLLSALRNAPVQPQRRKLTALAKPTVQYRVDGELSDTPPPADRPRPRGDRFGDRGGDRGGERRDFAPRGDRGGDRGGERRDFAPRGDRGADRGGERRDFAPRGDRGGDRGGERRDFAPRGDRGADRGGERRDFAPRGDRGGDRGGERRDFAPRAPRSVPSSGPGDAPRRNSAFGTKKSGDR